MGATRPAPVRLLRLAWLQVGLWSLRTMAALAAVLCAVMALASLAGVSSLGPLQAHWAVWLLGAEAAGLVAWALRRGASRVALTQPLRQLSQLRCPRCGQHHGLWPRTQAPCARCGQATACRWDGQTGLLIYAQASLWHLVLQGLWGGSWGLLLAVPLVLHGGLYLVPKD